VGRRRAQAVPPDEIGGEAEREQGGGEREDRIHARGL
jgi:hypothetical protein